MDLLTRKANGPGCVVLDMGAVFDRTVAGVGLHSDDALAEAYR